PRRAPAAHPLLNSAVMNKLLALGLSLPLVACVVGSGTDTSEPGPGPGSGSGSNPGTGTGTGNHITTNTMGSNTNHVNSQTPGDANVTLSIAARTTVTFGPSGFLVVNGTVDVQGTKTQVVNLVAATAGGHFGSTAVEAGGELKMDYAVQTGGG